MENIQYVIKYADSGYSSDSYYKAGGIVHAVSSIGEATTYETYGDAVEGVHRMPSGRKVTIVKIFTT